MSEKALPTSGKLGKAAKMTEQGGNLNVSFEGPRFIPFEKTQRQGRRPFNNVWGCNGKRGSVLNK